MKELSTTKGRKFILFSLALSLTLGFLLCEVAVRLLSDFLSDRIGRVCEPAADLHW
jgi:hypothetical protein